MDKLIRILVAEDEEALLRVYKRIFALPMIGSTETENGPTEAIYDLVLCQQGEEAVEEVRKSMEEHNPFALIFLDINMPPGRGGIWAAEQIRALDKEINIVFVTGRDEVSPEKIARRVPPVDRMLYLQKPFSVNEIRHFAATLAAKWHSEKKLRELHSEEKSRLVMAVEQAAEMIMTTDTEGVIQYVNPAFERMTGYTREEVSHRGLDILNSDRHEKAFFSEVWVDIAQGKTWKGRAINMRKDGTTYEVEAAISPVRDSSGKIISFVAVARDITKEMKLESQLRQAQKMEAIGELAAGIAHEINTPTQYIGDNLNFFKVSFSALAGLLGKFNELLNATEQRGGHGELCEELRTMIEDVDLEYLNDEIPLAIEQTLEGNNRVAEIVKAMKEFTHPGSKKKTAVNINQAIENTIMVARNEWKYLAAIETDFDPALPEVFCLPGEINQVVLNLIVNAAHAIGEKIGEEHQEMGVIGISTGFVDGMAEIRVRDTGPGISESIRSRIFDPFFTTKEVGKGTGQGLSIAHAVVVDKHGGSIDFVSEPGTGTTFIIRLPIEG